MKNVEIGVVVPTLNSAKTLDWTLLSLRNQQGCHVNIVVADSGSTDGTLDICQRWGVEMVYVPPGNMYCAINVGMQRLTTKWVAYLNSDDLVYEDSYARLIELGNKSGVDVVYGHCDYIDRFGRFLYSYRSADPWMLKRVFKKATMGFAQPSAIFRKDLFDALGGFSESYRLVSDSDFFLRALEAKKSFICLGGPSVCAFRLNPTQLHQREADAFYKERKKLRASLAYSSHFLDPFALIWWRAMNIPNYALKFIKTSKAK